MHGKIPAGGLKQYAIPGKTLTVENYKLLDSIRGLKTTKPGIKSLLEYIYFSIILVVTYRKRIQRIQSSNFWRFIKSKAGNI